MKILLKFFSLVSIFITVLSISNFDNEKNLYHEDFITSSVEKSMESKLEKKEAEASSNFTENGK